MRAPITNSPKPRLAAETRRIVGTAGERESSSATYTSFDRQSSRPNETVSVWYDSYRNLLARGVIPTPRPIAKEPQPFPNQFVPDPS